MHRLSSYKVRKFHIVPGATDDMYARANASRKLSLSAPTVHFWEGGISWNRLGHVHLSFFRSFWKRDLTRYIYGSLIDVSVKWSKRFHFPQFSLFIVFCSIFWPMIEYLFVLQEFLFQLLPS